MFPSILYRVVNSRSHNRKASTCIAALISALALVVFASGAQAADGKGSAAQESRQAVAGVQIESVIGNTERAPTLELLQEGFTIECSARFESGCKLFFNGN